MRMFGVAPSSSMNGLRRKIEVPFPRDLRFEFAVTATPATSAPSLQPLAKLRSKSATLIKL